MRYSIRSLNCYSLHILGAALSYRDDSFYYIK
jgi:hypothetical protein